KYLELTPNASEDEKTELKTLRWYRDLYKGIPQGEEVYSTKEVDTKVKIVNKPPPNFSGTRNAGLTTLRALLSSDGTVKHMLVLHKVDPIFDRACIEAARQIEFTPAIKDGHPVSIVVIVEYRRDFY